MLPGRDRPDQFMNQFLIAERSEESEQIDLYLEEMRRVAEQDLSQWEPERSSHDDQNPKDPTPASDQEHVRLLARIDAVRTVQAFVRALTVTGYHDAPKKDTDQ